MIRCQKSYYYLLRIFCSLVSVRIHHIGVFTSLNLLPLLDEFWSGVGVYNRPQMCGSFNLVSLFLIVLTVHSGFGFHGLLLDSPTLPGQQQSMRPDSSVDSPRFITSCRMQFRKQRIYMDIMSLPVRPWLLSFHCPAFSNTDDRLRPLIRQSSSGQPRYRPQPPSSLVDASFN
jgi:hypothetical protein